MSTQETKLIRVFTKYLIKPYIWSSLYNKQQNEDTSTIFNSFVECVQTSNMKEYKKYNSIPQETQKALFLEEEIKYKKIIKDCPIFIKFCAAHYGMFGHEEIVSGINTITESIEEKIAAPQESLPLTHRHIENYGRENYCYPRHIWLYISDNATPEKVKDYLNNLIYLIQLRFFWSHRGIIEFIINKGQPHNNIHKYIKWCSDNRLYQTRNPFKFNQERFSYILKCIYYLEYERFVTQYPKLPDHFTLNRPITGITQNGPSVKKANNKRKIHDTDITEHDDNKKIKLSDKEMNTAFILTQIRTHRLRQYTP